MPNSVKARLKSVSFLILFLFLFVSSALAVTPTLGTITPSSGSTAPNAAKTFTCKYSDSDGWANLKEAYLLINASTSTLSNSVYLYYNQNSNLLYLRDDANTSWLGGYSPGSVNTIENSQVKIDCASTTVSGSTNTLTVNWNIAFKQAYSGKIYNTYLKVVDDTGSYAGWTKKGTYTVNQSPQVGTIIPSSGTGQVNVAQVFTTTYSDPDGWQNLQKVYLLINADSSSFTKCFYGFYNQNTNKLYLSNDTNTGWLGGYSPGSSYTIQNSYVRLNCSKTSVSGSGTTLTVNWSVIINPPFTGAQNTYLYITDDVNADGAWAQKGTWTIPNNPPSAGTINPSSGSSTPDQTITFTTTYSDPDTYLNIKYVYLLVNTSTGRKDCFYGYFDQNTGRLYLRNDANTAWLGGYSPGSSYTIENSYAKLNCASTVVSVYSVNTLTVKWSVTFKSAFIGNKNTYLYVTDNVNASSDWTQTGSWGINLPPTIDSISPSNGVSNPGDTVTFTTTFSDAGGYQDIQYVNILVNSSFDPNNSFTGYYRRADNKLYLLDDANTVWLGGFSPGSNNTIENSQVKIDCANSSVTSSGNTLTVRWAVSFKSSFTGNKNTYLFVRDNANAYQGWLWMGTWRINSPPEATSVTASVKAIEENQPVVITATFTDLDGATDIQYMHILLNSSFAFSNSFTGYYRCLENKFYILNDANTAWVGGFSPGSNNIIENSQVKIDCANSSVTSNGNTLTINLAVSFKSNYVGMKNIYLFARDNLNAMSGWQWKDDFYIYRKAISPPAN